MSKNALPKEAKVYRGVGHSFYRIATVEGIRALQRFLLPAYFYQVIMNGVRFGGYEHVKRYVTQIVSPESFKEGRPHFFSNVISWAMSGMTGAAIGSPWFMVKTRLQSQSAQLAVGTQHNYTGMWDGFRKIFREDGMRGIFSGMQAAMIRTGVGSSIQLATYDRMRQFILSTGRVPDGVLADLGASLTSGFLVCVGMNPWDVISTRIYNQRRDHKTHRGAVYSGPLDCLVKTVRVEGFFGLYKGFWAHYGRIGPHTVLCFVFLEQLRRLAKANNIT